MNPPQVLKLPFKNTLQVHLCSKYLLMVYYMPGTLLDTKAMCVKPDFK